MKSNLYSALHVFSVVMYCRLVKRAIPLQDINSFALEMQFSATSGFIKILACCLAIKWIVIETSPSCEFVLMVVMTFFLKGIKFFVNVFGLIKRQNELLSLCWNYNILQWYVSQIELFM